MSGELDVWKHSPCTMSSDVCIIASKITAQFWLKTEKKLTSICRCNHIAATFYGGGVLPFQLDFFHIYIFVLCWLHVSASHDVVHVYPVLTCLPAVWVVGGCWVGGWQGLWCERGQKPHRTLILSWFFFPPRYFFLSSFHPAVSGDERCEVRREGARWWWHPTTNKRAPRLAGLQLFWLTVSSLVFASSTPNTLWPKVRQREEKPPRSRQLCQIKWRRGHWGGTKDSGRKMEWQSTQIWHFLCQGERGKKGQCNSLALVPFVFFFK